MAPFVSMGLKVSDEMGIMDTSGRQVVMRFCKIYSPAKVVRIVETAKQYIWWEKNPKAAFMKAVGEVNRKEKEAKNL